MPSQQGLVKLLSRYYSTQIKISQLNVWLRKLEDANQISRTRRLKRGPDGRLIQKTTLYHLKRAGYQALKRIGVAVSLFRAPREKVYDTKTKPAGTSAGVRDPQERGQKLARSKIKELFAELSAAIG